MFFRCRCSCGTRFWPSLLEGRKEDEGSSGISADGVEEIGFMGGFCFNFMVKNHVKSASNNLERHPMGVLCVIQLFFFSEAFPARTQKLGKTAVVRSSTAPGLGFEKEEDKGKNDRKIERQETEYRNYRVMNDG